jgi:hypothetical protein
MTRAMNSTSAESKALTYRCFAANYGNNRSAPGAGLNTGEDSYALPTKACTGGIRSQIYFPTCWDGKNLDSPDHKTHVAYVVNGKCPTSHPVSIPQILLETIWDTRDFNSMWPTGGSQPFVYSMGDPTGYGQHADYVFGWKDDSLQKAMDTCKSFPDTSCKVLATQSADASIKCQQKPRVNENNEGWLKALPGCNAIQAGPGRAQPVNDCGAPATYLP